MASQQQSALEKLQEGQRILSTAGEDRYKLGAALLMLHGALEDRLRDLLASRLPARNSEIYDNHTTSWRDILDLSEQYLGLSSTYSDAISKANWHRNNYAHDVNFTWDRKGLISYEQLIRQVWNTGSRAGSPLKPNGHSQQDNDFSRSVNMPQANQVSQPFYQVAGKPWYRSTAFYWFLYLFLMPIWSVMILTDRSKGCLLKSFAIVSVFLYTAGVYFALVFFNLLPFDLLSIVLSPTRTAAPTTVPTRMVTPAASTTGSQVAVPGAPAGCDLIWEEYRGSDLDNKNRATVWNEGISARVAGSGMEPRQFYQQVVEYNPVLKTDGYVFMTGKSYVLPRCR